MLTKLTIRNFKRFGQAEIELGNPVVFVGPNNSGKTTALQALALWELGLRRWSEKYKDASAVPRERPGVSINRLDLVAVPVSDADLLWRARRTHVGGKKNGKAATQKVFVEVVVDGVDGDTEWECGFQFYHANAESFYCRLLPTRAGGDERGSPPAAALGTRVALLPPMSGLASQEFLKQRGEVDFLIGQGRTAEVLRNLAYQLHQQDPAGWTYVVQEMERLFGAALQYPAYIKERAELRLQYSERPLSDATLDLASSGKGFQQMLLLLLYLTLHSNRVLLLDEPDAHLEVLRQREMYNALCDAASRSASQVVIASHSEVVLQEAADRDVVVAFVGSPHRIDDRGSQVLKALKEIGFDQYYQAEQRGWVLYVEGATDLEILRAFAKKLNHPARVELERPFMRPIGNHPASGRSHFHALREAKPNLVGVLICDRQERSLQPTLELVERMWRRREIENYLFFPETLLAFAAQDAIAPAEQGRRSEDQERGLRQPDLFQAQRTSAMQAAVSRFFLPAALDDRADRWWVNEKASDNVLDRVFEEYYAALNLPNLMRKSDYHRLVEYVPLDLIDPEVTEVLDAILNVASQARPASAVD